MPDSKVTNVTREHRAEAARLLGFDPAPSGWHLNVLAHRWVEGEPVPEWWLAEREQGALLPPVAQALADRDAQAANMNGIRNVLLERLQSELTDTKAQLARVVGALREACDSVGMSGFEMRQALREVLKGIDDGK